VGVRITHPVNQQLGVHGERQILRSGEHA
jgi:hypothetical protein